MSDQGTHHHRKQKSQPGPSNTRRRLQPEGRPSLPAGPRSGLSSSSLGRGSLNSRSTQEPGFTRNEQESNCLPNVQVSRLDRGFKPFMGGGGISPERAQPRGLVNQRRTIGKPLQEGGGADRLEPFSPPAGSLVLWRRQNLTLEEQNLLILVAIK